MRIFGWRNDEVRRSYLRLHYPGKSVKKLEMGKKEYEVELANGMEFTFNKHFQLIDIDWSPIFYAVYLRGRWKMRFFIVFTDFSV